MINNTNSTSLENLYDQSFGSGQAPQIDAQQEPSKQDDELTALYDAQHKKTEKAIGSSAVTPSALVQNDQPLLNRVVNSIVSIAGRPSDFASIYNALEHLPGIHVLNEVGKEAGHTVAQMADNVINMAAKHHLLSRFMRSALLGIKAPTDSLVSTLESRIAKRPLKAKEFNVSPTAKTIGDFVGSAIPFAAATAIGGPIGEGIVGPEALEALKGGSAAQKVLSHIPGMIGRSVAVGATAPVLDGGGNERKDMETGALTSLGADIGAPVLAKTGALTRKAGSALWKKIMKDLKETRMGKEVLAKLSGIVDNLRVGANLPKDEALEKAGPEVANRMTDEYEKETHINQPEGSKPAPGTAAAAYASADQNAPYDPTRYYNVVEQEIGQLNNVLKSEPKNSQAFKKANAAINFLRDNFVEKDPETLSTLGEAMKHKENINEMIRNRRTPQNLLGPLTNIVHEGIYNGALDSAERMNPDDLAKIKIGDELYKKNVVPFIKETDKRGSRQAPFMQMYYTGTKPASLWTKLVPKNARADETQPLERALKAMKNDPSFRDLLLYNHVKQHLDNPKKLLQAWEKLGHNTKRLLAPDYADDLDDLSAFSKNHPKSFNLNSGDTLSNALKLNLKNMSAGSLISSATHALGPTNLAGLALLKTAKTGRALGRGGAAAAKYLAPNVIAATKDFIKKAVNLGAVNSDTVDPFADEIAQKLTSQAKAHDYITHDEKHDFADEMASLLRPLIINETLNKKNHTKRKKL